MIASASARACFALMHLCLGGPQLRFGFGRGDCGDHLSGGDLVAFVNVHRREPTRIFCRNVHLGRFDPAIRFHDAIGHVFAAEAIDQRFHRFASLFERVLPVSFAHWR